MKKKTVDRKFFDWMAKEYPILDSELVCVYMDTSYKAGHKSCAIELNREIRKQKEKNEELKATVLQLVEACEGYAKENAELEAYNNALEYDKQHHWEKAVWGEVEIGDWICYRWPDAATLFKVVEDER